MGTVRRALASAVVVAAFAGALSAPAAARTIHVFDGEWIQGAVKRAEAGDSIFVHPGVYRQSVQIKKNGLTLEGASATKDGTVIKPPRSTRRCSDGADGICVLGHRTNSGNRVKTSGAEISGFLIRGFHGSGLFTLDAKNTVIRHNSFINNDEYGAFALASKRTEFLHNRARGSGQAGFYVGSSPNSHTVLRGNRARRNGDFGFFLRDAAHGVAINNQVARNCLGIGLVNTGAPGGVHDWKVRGNEVLKNQARCPEGGGGSISGTGIGLLGARGNVVRNNTVVGNRTDDPAAFAPGGIVLISSVPFGGTPAANNKIRRNWAFRNAPADIVWDGNGQGNRFFRNRCDTSQPGGLCN